MAQLANAKGLPVSALTRYGVIATHDMSAADRLKHGISNADGLWIPYALPDGTIAPRTRLRTAIAAKDGSRWLGGPGPILPYGLGDLASARSQGCVCLCEGESDYWTLRHAELPALGIPGAQMVRTLTAEHLADIPTVYVCQDSDPAGAAFVRGLQQSPAIAGRTVSVLRMPTGCKDVNDLYRRDPGGFAEAFLALMVESAKAPTAGRVFASTGDRYAFTVPEHGLRLELDQVRRSWGDLHGELAITTEHGEDISRASVNLSAIEKRQAFALQLAKRNGSDVDWPELIEDFAVRCLRAERTAGAVVDLRVVSLPTAEQTWEIDRFILSRRDATCLFGDGGTGKSLLALYLAGVLARQGVKVLYLDAEWEATIHKERLVSLFGEPVPPVLYLEQRRPLELAASQVRRHLADHAIDFVMLDSVGLLTVGAPEESGAALGYSRALQSCGIGSLSLAHIRKPQTGNEIRPQDQKPFGSVFYHNLFRRTYFVKADTEGATQGDKQIGVWNPKWNHRGRGQAPFGLTIVEQDGHTVIQATNIAHIESLAVSLPLWQRIRELLRRGPQTADTIAEELGAPPKQVTAALSKGKSAGRFAKVSEQYGAPWCNA